MRRAHRFRPTDLDTLEGRLLMTGNLAKHTLASQIVGGATPGTPTNKGAVRRIADTINQSFDNFTTDYLQAQSAYLTASSADSSAINANKALFKSFIQQRISLLSQELVQELARVPGSLRRLTSSQRSQFGNSQVYLQAFLHTRINGPGRVSLQQLLTKQINLVPTTQGAGLLYTMSATNAIESARTATINAAGFVSNGNFGVKSH